MMKETTDQYGEVTINNKELKDRERENIQMETDIRYVYSPTYTSYDTRRIIIDGQATPEKEGGSAIIKGTLMDTGEPYPSIETLAEDRYQSYEMVSSEYLYTHTGLLWLHPQGDHRTWSAMEHKITNPGTHYIVEWISKSEKGGFHKGDAYSKLYPTFQEALNQLQLHLQKTIGERPDESYDIERSEDKTQYKVHYKRRLEGITTPGYTYFSMDTSDTIDRYIIIPIEISEEVYTNAQTEPNNMIALERAYINY